MRAARLSLPALPALVALAAGCAVGRNVSVPEREALPFIEDDFERAQTEAKSSARPIFVETWAPW